MGKNKFKSNCCNSTIKQKCNDKNETTDVFYSICNKCKQPCQVHLDERKSWARNPATQIIPNKKKKSSTKLTKKELNEIHQNEDF